MSRTAKTQFGHGRAAATPAAAEGARADPGPADSPWQRDWLAGLALLALALITYEGVRHAGFIWDDEMHVTENPVIVGPQGLRDIWTTRAARYFPLTLTTFWTEHALWGLKPLPYHVVNVFMHGASAVVLWRVLKRLRVAGAWLGAALWALHPVQAETVAWITELKNTQSCLFYLLAVLFYVKWLSEARAQSPARGLGLYALALISAAMAMASKSSTVVLPVVLCLCAWWTVGRLRWRTVAALAPVFLMSLASGALALWTQHLEGANVPEWSRSLPERIAIAGKVVWFYLGKLVWPDPLIFIYPRWHVDLGQGATFLPVASACGVLLFLGWKGRERLRPVLFAYAYFLVALVPVLGLADQYFWRYSFVGDHLQYLASIGPLALAAAAISTWLGFPEKGRPVLASLLCGVLLTVLGVLTARECRKYHDSESLWRSTLARNPGAWMAHNNLGAELMQAGRIEEAVAQFQESLELQPDNGSAHTNLGYGLLQLGRTDEALAHYNKALEIDPHDDAAHANLGAALLQLGRIDEAIPHLRRALQENPGFTRARVNLGSALLQQGRPDEAVALFKRALAAEPENFATVTDLGAAYAQEGQLKEALAQFKRALELNPNYAIGRTDLGNVLLQEGRADEAIDEYGKALLADPNSAETHNNLAYALLQKGRPKEAVAHYRRALEIRPDYPEARRNLEEALLEARGEDRADASTRGVVPRK